MKLVRHVGGLPQLHLGPEPGGRFFGLAEAHDLPSPYMTFDLEDILKLGLRVWLGNAEKLGTWVPVVSAEQLAGFHMKSYQVPASDGWGWETHWRAEPFMPELYIKPFGFREMKALRIMGRIARQGY